MQGLVSRVQEQGRKDVTTSSTLTTYLQSLLVRGLDLPAERMMKGACGFCWQRVDR